MEQRRTDRPTEFAPPTDYIAPDSTQPKKRGRPKKQATSSPPAAKMMKLSQQGIDFTTAQLQSNNNSFQDLPKTESASLGSTVPEPQWPRQAEGRNISHFAGSSSMTGLPNIKPQHATLPNNAEDGKTDCTEAESSEALHSTQTDNAEQLYKESISVDPSETEIAKINNFLRSAPCFIDIHSRPLPDIPTSSKIDVPWKDMPPPRPYPLPEVATYPYTRTAAPSRLLSGNQDGDKDKSAVESDGDMKPLQSVSLPEPTTKPLHHMPPDNTTKTENNFKPSNNLNNIGESLVRDSRVPAALPTSHVVDSVTRPIVSAINSSNLNLSTPTSVAVASEHRTVTVDQSNCGSVQVFYEHALPATNGVMVHQDGSSLDLSRSETPPVSTITTTEPFPIPTSLPTSTAPQAQTQPQPQPDWTGEMPMRLSVPFPMMHSQWPFSTPPGYVGSIPPLSMMIPPYSSNSMSQLLPGMACAQGNVDEAQLGAGEQNSATVSLSSVVTAAEPAQTSTKLPSFSSLFSPRVPSSQSSAATEVVPPTGNIQEQNQQQPDISAADIAGVLTAVSHRTQPPSAIPVQVKQVIIDNKISLTPQTQQPSVAVQIGQGAQQPVLSTQPVTAVILQAVGSCAQQRVLTPVVTVHHQPQVTTSQPNANSQQQQTENSLPIISQLLPTLTAQALNITQVLTSAAAQPAAELQTQKSQAKTSYSPTLSPAPSHPAASLSAPPQNYATPSPPVRPHSVPQGSSRSPQPRRTGHSPKPVPDNDPAVMERVQNILAQYRQAVTDLGEQANTPAPRRK